MNINKAAVIGAGVMGSGIAAHISNAGVPVYLLDVVPDNAANRNVIAEGALKKLLKAQPAALMHKKNSRLITPGNIEDHLDLLDGVDWVIEAVVENPQIKHQLYTKLDSICPETTLISSNTSTLPLALLTDGMPESFRKRFMITHFFNPPRYMRLLELVASSETQSELVKGIGQFADKSLGKGCVTCKDTPGFIANRIGVYWLQCGLLEAMEGNLTIEEADAVMGKPFGIPKTGIFGLLDLIGLDLIPQILQGMKLALPGHDSFHEINQVPGLVQKMIADGYTGRKGKGGFYRLNKADGKRIKESINLDTGTYHPSEKPRLDSIQASDTEGLKALMDYDDKTGRYAWRVFSKTLAYAANLVPEIADDFVTIDMAMKWGYNWKKGPFELLDEIGVDWFVEKMTADGHQQTPTILRSSQTMYTVQAGEPYYLDQSGSYKPLQRSGNVLLLSDCKLRTPALLERSTASLWNVGDGIACLEFHGKMNTLDPDVMALIHQTIDKVKSDMSALVIYNDGDQFSAGANLSLLVEAIHQQAWSDVENFIKQGQDTYKALKYAPFPVVGAPSGLTLGGACEILLHCDAIQAHAELYLGLVEVGVGLIPGWGGCKEYLRRWIQQSKRPGGPMPPIIKAFEVIGTATTSKSALEARELLFLAESDGITMNKDRLLADAKAKAITLCKDYIPPEPPEFQLPGATAKAALDMAVENYHAQGKASNYDVEISQRLADVLSGGDTDITDVISEDELLALELDAFMRLVRQPQTVARLEYTLKTGKPLRN